MTLGITIRSNWLSGYVVLLYWRINSLDPLVYLLQTVLLKLVTGLVTEQLLNLCFHLRLQLVDAGNLWAVSETLFVLKSFHTELESVNHLTLAGCQLHHH